MAGIKWRTHRKRLAQKIHWLWIKVVLPCLRPFTQLLNLLWRRISQDKQFALVLFSTLALIFSLFFFGILPTSQPFEGNLLVKSLSFTNTESDRLLLKDLRDLQEATLSGIQTFTLAGTITSSDHPELNKLNKLDIDLIADNSYIQIQPTADLTLQELRLQPQTRVKTFKYAPYPNTLSFQLTPNPPSPPQLLFNPRSPLTITLSGYRLHNPNLTSNDTPLQFTLDTTQFQLTPTQTIDINLKLPPAKPDDPFWRNINVEKVRFERLVQSSNNVGDDIVDSTISSGEIRMARQELKLAEDQFLIVADPGVQTLNKIQIVKPDRTQPELKTSGENLKLADPPQGLNISFSGTTTSIRAGLNQNLAVSQIQGTILSRYLSDEVIVAIITLSAGLIVSLLSWLFNNFEDYHN